MSPLNGTVLVAAAVVASPALYDGFVSGTMPTDTALTRYLVAVGVCWLLLSVLVDLVLPSREEVARAVAARDAAPPTPATGTPGAFEPGPTTAYDAPPAAGPAA